MPDSLLTPGEDGTDPKKLLERVYGDLSEPANATAERLIGRAILTPRNADVQIINDHAADIFPGELRMYHSADSVPELEDSAYPPGTSPPSHIPPLPSRSWPPPSHTSASHPPNTEVLNTLNPAGLPAHELKLKVGMIVILLRNINLAQGLANGTRLIIRHLSQNVIQAEIVTGADGVRGRLGCIPRLTMMVQAGDDNPPFTFTRRQFPLRAAFAMTINKAQGQTFSRVGVFLPTPVFAHDQLYVALSRCGGPRGVFVMIAHPQLPGAPEEDRVTYTYNIVSREMFDGLLAPHTTDAPTDMMEI